MQSFNHTHEPYCTYHEAVVYSISPDGKIMKMLMDENAINMIDFPLYPSHRYTWSITLNWKSEQEQCKIKNISRRNFSRR
jgi:hypothetical protein